MMAIYQRVEESRLTTRRFSTFDSRVALFSEALKPTHGSFERFDRIHSAAMIISDTRTSD